MEISISFSTKTSMTNLAHNNRELTDEEFKQEAHKHIDRELTKDNIIIKQEDIHDVYEREFGSALQEYNTKQKRADRKIKDYYQHVGRSKTLDRQREFVVGLGTKEDWDNLSREKKIEAGEKLADYVREFEIRHPQLKLYNAIVHLDEKGAPHAHFNVVPVAEGYKNGLKRQPSFSKALSQEGISSKGKFQFQDFRNAELAILETKLNELGMERKLVGTNDIKDMHKYKEIVSKAEEEIAKIDFKATEKLSELSQVESNIKDRSNVLKALEGKIRAYKEELKVGREFSNGWRTKFSGELKKTAFGKEYIRLDPKVYENARMSFVWQENTFQKYEEKISDIRRQLGREREARFAVIEERNDLREQVTDLKTRNKWLEGQNQGLYDRLDLTSKKLAIWRHEAKKLMSVKEFKDLTKYLNQFMPLKPVIEAVKVVKKVMEKGLSL